MTKTTPHLDDKNVADIPQVIDKPRATTETTDADIATEAIALHKQALQFLTDKRPTEALALLVRAVELMPDEPVFRLQLAMAANAVARETDPLRELAVQNAMHVCKLYPENPVHWISLGEICLAANKYHESVAAFERALIVQPGGEATANIWSLLGFANERAGNRDGAKHCYLMAVKIDPELGQAHFFLSMFYHTAEYWDVHKLAFHAEKAFTAKKPATNAIDSYWNAAHGYLHAGDYSKGWSYFEARLRRMTLNVGYQLPGDRFTKKMWQGERNCRVLITAEMGFGDSFIMARFLPLIQERFGFKLLLETHPGTRDLLQASFPNIRCVLTDEINEDDFDKHIPIMSLPHVLRIKSERIPNHVPYITPRPIKVSEWATRAVPEIAQKILPHIGVCWSGGSRSYNAANHQTDKQRSLTYAQIKPLLDIEGVKWISLQAEGASDEFKMHPDAKTFEDTAAIMTNLDAVISVDTAIINLAGAMGKNGWVLSRYNGCWRWSPHLKSAWFPSIKILRQHTPGMWGPPLAQLFDEVKQFRDTFGG